MQSLESVSRHDDRPTLRQKKPWRSRGQYQGGIYDKRPCRGEGFVRDKVYGIYVDQSSDVEINGLKVINDGVNFGGDVKGYGISADARRGAKDMKPGQTAPQYIFMK